MANKITTKVITRSARRLFEHLKMNRLKEVEKGGNASQSGMRRSFIEAASFLHAMLLLCATYAAG